MKKLLFVLIAAFLLMPAIALAEENPGLISPAPTEEVTTETTAQPETTPSPEPTITPVFSIEVFGYTIAVSEIDGVTTVALLKENEDGVLESLAVYDFSGPLGRVVSTVAHIVAPGPAHGKVVSSFVQAVNELRREKKREEIQQRKEERETVRKEKRERKELGKGEKEQIRQQKEERKTYRHEKREENKLRKGKGNDEDDDSEEETERDNSHGQWRNSNE